jgi:hypothetical protein
MSDYIADRLYLLMEELQDVPDMGKSGYVPSFISESLKEVEEDLSELKGREIFAFARSALNAASDLRIDTPERLDRLATAVLDTPRKLFVETHGPDRGLVAGNLRGFLPVRSTAPIAESIEGYGERWGVFVDILGGGKARFRSVYTRPKLWMRKSKSFAKIDEAIEGLPKEMKSPARRAYAFDFSPHWYHVDISRHVGMSRQEFGVALERMGRGVDPIFDMAKEKLAKTEGKRERASIADSAWRLSRFRDLIREEPLNAAQQSGVMRSLSQSLMSHKSLSLPDGITLIAMLAVLEADSDDIRKKPRSKPPKREQKGKTKSSRSLRPFAEGLSVVTLNIEDRDLREIYQRGADDAKEGASGGSAHVDGSMRARHPVRGHLFMARNGKLVWRKPHWRGSLEKLQIKRVIAPSH